MLYVSRRTARASHLLLQGAAKRQKSKVEPLPADLGAGTRSFLLQPKGRRWYLRLLGYPDVRVDICKQTTVP